MESDGHVTVTVIVTVTVTVTMTDGHLSLFELQVREVMSKTDGDSFFRLDKNCMIEYGVTECSFAVPLQLDGTEYTKP